MYKIVLAAVALLLVAGCARTIDEQEDTEKVKYGKSYVSFLLDSSSPPGCELWKSYHYEIDPNGKKVIPAGSSGVFVTICRGIGLATKSKWTEQSGKTSTDYETFTFFDGRP